MTPHAFYKGLLRDMRTHLVEPKTFCPNCGKPFPSNGDEYCSTRCAEDHDTVQKGGTPLPEHERCTCDERMHSLRAPFLTPLHDALCPRYVPHPENSARDTLTEPERCMCPALIGSATHGFGRHAWDCPCFVPHPEDFTHPLENE